MILHNQILKSYMVFVSHSRSESHRAVQFLALWSKTLLSDQLRVDQLGSKTHFSEENAI